MCAVVRVPAHTHTHIRRRRPEAPSSTAGQEDITLERMQTLTLRRLLLWLPLPPLLARNICIPRVHAHARRQPNVPITLMKMYGVVRMRRVVLLPAAAAAAVDAHACAVGANILTHYYHHNFSSRLRVHAHAQTRPSVCSRTGARTLELFPLRFFLLCCVATEHVCVYINVGNMRHVRAAR